MRENLQYWLPGLIAAVANIIFYLAIKRYVDNSIERFKVAYSGVFKEKIDIYKSILMQLHDLKLLLNQFQYSDDQSTKSIIRESFDKLIKYYLVNRPFLSENLVTLFNENTKEMQKIFEDMALANIQHYRHMPNNEIDRREQAYWAAVNRLRDDKVLTTIENRIISEMRKDLNVS